MIQCRAYYITTLLTHKYSNTICVWERKGVVGACVWGCRAKLYVWLYVHVCVCVCFFLVCVCVCVWGGVGWGGGVGLGISSSVFLSNFFGWILLWQIWVYYFSVVFVFLFASFFLFFFFFICVITNHWNFVEFNLEYWYTITAQTCIVKNQH